MHSILMFRETRTQKTIKLCRETRTLSLPSDFTSGECPTKIAIIAASDASDSKIGLGHRSWNAYGSAQRAIEISDVQTHAVYMMN